PWSGFTLWSTQDPECPSCVVASVSARSRVSWVVVALSTTCQPPAGVTQGVVKSRLTSLSGQARSAAASAPASSIEFDAASNWPLTQNSPQRTPDASVYCPSQSAQSHPAISGPPHCGG